MDTSRTYATVTAIEIKLGDLNSLLLHGVPESSEDTTEAASPVFNTTLDLLINSEHIGRSHHLGQPRCDTDSDRSRPIIVRCTRYETRRRVFILNGSSRT